MSNIITTDTFSEISNLAELGISCKKAMKVPENLVKNYQKFFDFVIPKNTEQIYVILPHSYVERSMEMQAIIEKIRPTAKVQVLLTTKSTDIFLCLS